MLIIRLSALGDVAMTLPIIYSVARQHPELDLYVLTRPFFAKLFVNAPSNIKLLRCDIARDYNGSKGMMKLLKVLDTFGFDYVADLHNVMRSWIIGRYFSLKGKPVIMVDKQRNERRRILKGQCDNRHDYIERYVEVFEKLGFPITLDFQSLFETPPILPVKVEAPAVGIAPFARYFNKTYPLDQMEKVVELLSERGYNVYLFGSKGDESAILRGWAAKYRNAYSVAGEYPITDELAIMSRLDLMVSMDSANQHMSSIVATPVITLWGSTTPVCGFAPYKADLHTHICLNLDCQPCTIAGSPECHKGHFACMRNITPEMVVTRIDEILRPEK